MVVIRGQVELLLSKIEVGVEVEVTETSVAFKNSDPGPAIISEMGHNKGSHTSPIAQVLGGENGRFFKTSSLRLLIEKGPNKLQKCPLARPEELRSTF